MELLKSQLKMCQRAREVKKNGNCFKTDSCQKNILNKYFLLRNTSDSVSARKRCTKLMKDYNKILIGKKFGQARPKT